MKEVILITGANGMLAKHLTTYLEKEFALKFLTRNVTQKNEYQWDLKKKYIDPDALHDVHYIIHLAGAPIAVQRWTKKRKQTIVSSRVDSAQLLLKELKKHKLVVKAFISASAVGFYGTTSSENIFDEESPKGNDFLSDVCNAWENAANAFKTDNHAERVAIARIGIILAQNEGALQKIIQPIKLGVGAAIGTGNQYMPWIHIDDLCRMFVHMLTNKQIAGTFNAVAPEHISNIELTKNIAKRLNRPLILPNIPKFVMSLLFGEMASILLYGSRVSSTKIQNQGFQFTYGNINSALKNAIQSKNGDETIEN